MYLLKPSMPKTRSCDVFCSSVAICHCHCHRHCHRNERRSAPARRQGQGARRASPEKPKRSTTTRCAARVKETKARGATFVAKQYTQSASRVRGTSSRREIRLAGKTCGAQLWGLRQELPTKGAHIVRPKSREPGILTPTNAAPFPHRCCRCFLPTASGAAAGRAQAHIRTTLHHKTLMHVVHKNACVFLRRLRSTRTLEPTSIHEMGHATGPSTIMRV